MTDARLSAPHALRQCAPLRRRAAFTLIELLAVILIISILAVALLPQITPAIERTNVTACNRNLSSIYEGLMLHNTKYGDLPQKGGVAFFASLISREVWETPRRTPSGSTARPSRPRRSAGSRGSMRPSGTRISRCSTGDWSSYAGRDIENYPLRKFRPAARSRWWPTTTTPA